MAGKSKILLGILGELGKKFIPDNDMGALGNIANAPFKIDDNTYDFTNSAPEGSDQIGGFMSAVDMIHKPTGTRIPADTKIRGHTPDFIRSPEIPALDEDTARRILMGEITLDEAKKELGTKPILPTQRKIDITNEVMKMIDLSEANPFQLFEDVEGYQFVNKTLMNELSKAIEMNNYNDAKKYMDTIQDKFEDFGAGDSEATNLIDTVLEEVFFEGE